jgi:hypothetical protein
LSDALAAGLAFVPLTLISMMSTQRPAALLLGRWGLRTTLWVGLLVNGIGLPGPSAGVCVRDQEASDRLRVPG